MIWLAVYVLSFVCSVAWFASSHTSAQIRAMSASDVLQGLFMASLLIFGLLWSFVTIIRELAQCP